MSNTPLKIVNKSIGKSGTETAGGIITEDHITNLQAPDRAATLYNKMRRSDTQVRKILAAIMNPIKSAKWSVDPASDGTKDLEAAALMDQIIFKDICWPKHLHEALTYVPLGYSAFEVVHENKENPEFGLYTGLKQLGFRNQETITRFDFDRDTGHLTEIYQQSFGDVVSNVWIPSDQLLMYYHEQEGDNMGFPLLRNLYGAWKRKNLAQELMFIGIERFAIPTPLLEVPSNTDPNSQEYKDAQEILSKFTSAENAYIMYPQGWPFKLQSNTFDPSKVREVIKSEDEAMSGAILATFLELGIGGNSGAFALGDNLAEFFLNGIESLANVITDTINGRLIPSLMRLNMPEVTVMPEMSYSGVKDVAGKEQADIIAGLKNAGIISADEPLEDHVRKIYSLPKKAEGTMLENQAAEESVERTPEAPAEEEPEPPQSEPEDPNQDQEINLSTKLSLSGIKNPKDIIKRDEDLMTEILREGLRFTGEKYVADVMKRYNELSPARKLQAPKKVKVGGLAKLKRAVRQQLAISGADSLDLARRDVPGAKDVKLKDDPRILKILDPQNAIKLQLSREERKLPRREQILIQQQSGQVVDRLGRDLTERAEFQFTSSESSTNDPEVLRSDMQKKVDEFVEGPAPALAAANATAMIVNETRNDFLFDDEVLEEIQSFTFMNFAPKAPICQRLAGRTFNINDSDFMRFQPPLHHNCKSYIRANLKKSKNQPQVEGLPTITETERKSITLAQRVNKGAFRC